LLKKEKVSTRELVHPGKFTRAQKHKKPPIYYYYYILFSHYHNNRQPTHFEQLITIINKITNTI
jgi:hypothetical protein